MSVSNSHSSQPLWSMRRVRCTLWYELWLFETDTCRHWAYRYLRIFVRLDVQCQTNFRDETTDGPRGSALLRFSQGREPVSGFTTRHGWDFSASAVVQSYHGPSGSGFEPHRSVFGSHRRPMHVMRQNCLFCYRRKTNYMYLLPFFLSSPDDRRASCTQEEQTGR